MSFPFQHPTAVSHLSILADISIQREGSGIDMLIPSYQQISLGSGGNNTVVSVTHHFCDESKSDVGGAHYGESTMGKSLWIE